jgi:serine/threonine-protein phosphatase 2A regulatory subunit A
MSVPKKDSKMDIKSLTPIGVLIDELKSEDPKKRISSIRSLSTIAIALGPERTRNELIPFANELLDDEDEVLAILSDTLPILVDYVGGPQFHHLVLAALEKLCYVEDQTVRDKAIGSLKKVLTSIDCKKNEDVIMKMIRGFTSADFHTAKAAASSLITTIYPNISVSSQNELLTIYTNLCNDELPLVRKAAGQNLRDLVKSLSNANEAGLLNCYNTLLKDDQDFVKLYLIDALIAFAKCFTSAKINSIILPQAKLLAEDPSWRIRYTVAEKIFELGSVLGKESNKKNMLPYFIKFLQDPESEIKTIAATKLAAYAELLDADDLVTKIIPIIKPLAQPENSPQHVRAAVASSLLQLCPVVGKKHTNDIILSIFLVLLRDEFSEVRVNLFKNLDDITKVIDIESLSQSLIPALTELAVDKNWRTRSNAVEFLPIFARKMGEDFFNEKFSKILIDWLMDKVFGVREAAVRCVKALTELLGPIWAERHLFPRILQMKENTNYLHRMTPLFCVQACSHILGHEYLCKQLMPTLQGLAKDGVANVRMNVARTIKSCMGHFKDKTYEDLARKTLQQLADDSDPDVKYTAKIALS